MDRATINTLIILALTFSTVSSLIGLVVQKQSRKLSAIEEAEKSSVEDRLEREIHELQQEVNSLKQYLIKSNTRCIQ